MLARERDYNDEELMKMGPIEIYKLVINKRINKFPKGYWKEDVDRKKALELFKWYFEENLKWSTDDIKRKIKLKILKRDKMYNVLNIKYEGSYYKMLEELYPKQFKIVGFPRYPSFKINN